MLLRGCVNYENLTFKNNILLAKKITFIIYDSTLTKKKNIRRKVQELPFKQKT